MERWWNCVVEITVPFDTRDDARNAFTDDETIDRLFEIFGNSAVISGGSRKRRMRTDCPGYHEQRGTGEDSLRALLSELPAVAGP